MRACSSDLFVRSLLSLTALALLTQPARAQTDSTQAQDPTTAPVTSSLPPAPAPKAPVGPPNLAKMSPGQIANLAAYNIALASLAVSHYTYKEIEHNENFIDGQLVVNHTTVTENIFINNLPYMRKIMVDGKPLEGKELKAEQKLYDQAVKERRALDASARIAIEKHAVRTTSPNIDRLSTVFQLKLDGHQTIDGQDCVVLDAMPPAGNANPDLAQHIRIALEADTGDVLDVKVEFLADDNGFAKGSVLHTHYAIIGANALPDHQTWDTVVTFKELLGKPITIHRDITYIDYKRFRATVTIKSFSLADGKDPGPDSTPATPAPGPESPNPVAPGTASPVAESAPAEKPAPAPKLSAEEKAKLKADERAKADADAKARADERAEAKTKAEEEAKAKAEARAEAKAKADADAKAKAEELAQARADAKAKADAEAKALAEARAEAKAKADADARAKAEALAQAKADERARAKADANARAEAKAKSDALAKADAAETAKLKADLARSEAEEKAKMKAQAADLAKSEALAKAQLKEQAKEQTKLDAAAKAKAKADADAKAKTPPTTADAPSPTQPPSNNLH